MHFTTPAGRVTGGPRLAASRRAGRSIPPAAAAGAPRASRRQCSAATWASANLHLICSRSQPSPG